MSIKSMLKKVGLATLLAVTMGCNSLSSHKESNLETRIRKPSKLRTLAIPVNFLAGYVTMAAQHEGNHALIGTMCGAEIEKLEIPYTSPDGTFYPCALRFKPETWPEAGSTGDTAIRLAGPLGQRLFIEGINYNLRNGNIPQEAQQFWATTSLIARFTLLETAIGALRGNQLNDLYEVSKNTGISPKIIFGILAADLALNAKRIKEELEVALGKGFYKFEPSKARFGIYPTYNGFFATYSREF